MVEGLQELTGRLWVAEPSDHDMLVFTDIYDAWFRRVLHWLRACGTPDSELEDIAQEVFIIIRRKLGSFDGANLGGWIYRITSNTASDHRRRSWFRNLFSKSEPLEDSSSISRVLASDLLETKQARQILHRLLDQMSEKRRRAFALFEIEGYTTEEIAELEGIPVATVRTRLHHARKEFYELVAKLSRGKAT